MLNDDQRAQFDCQGYLLIERALDPEAVLDPIVSEYVARLDILAHDLHASGKLTSLHNDLDFRASMTAICRETGETYPQFFNLSLPMTGVSEDTPIWTGILPSFVARHRSDPSREMTEA